ncbi:YoaK family protein [Rhodococcus sp. G-MC3]|uniref:YoaK family protein n=1 Tax=Rhodococcus sp. G-MC3 TaxID=3046209 RepID=UPI0024B882A4|nr:YoaK family protein [Rhodococcus sp. G-MC3]MDJ0394807.1 YoaK family protein [Rhodococcus sp. G-MC3]
MTAPTDSHLRSPWLLLVLSFGAGATDAFAFLSLGGIFTANMTGNLVLVGLVGREEYLDTLVGAAIAIAVFFVVLLAGFRYVHTSTATPTRSTTVLLALAAAIQVGTFAAWWILDNPPAEVVIDVLVALSASAMALQTVVARTSAVGGGLSTTFVTGTMVNVVDDLAQGKTEYLALRLGAIAALVAGSFAGAVSILLAPGLGPLVSAATGCIALGLVVRR